MTILHRIGVIRVRRRTMYLILVACAVLGSYGIAHASPTPAQVRRAVDPAFTARRVSLGVLAVAAVADVVTTEAAFHRGCHKLNGTLYGSHPGLPLLIGVHGLVVGGSEAIHAPAWANYAAAALFGFAAIHNANVRCVR
jgi:hypothetical protein